VARTGRRKGSPDTRDAILAAARDQFADRGFDGASVRQIATSAGVDPALVHHYFGTKDGLFLATIEAPMDPRQVLSAAVVGPRELVAERLLRAALGVWEHPTAGPSIVALARSAISHDWSARMIREFLTTQILRRVMNELQVPPDEAPTRSALVASQLFGLLMIRHVMKIEPLASASVDTVVAAVAPTMQRYLTGDVGRLEK
jgi:AcrR family transcriptional regulator